MAHIQRPSLGLVGLVASCLVVVVASGSCDGPSSSACGSSDAEEVALLQSRLRTEQPLHLQQLNEARLWKPQVHPFAQKVREDCKADEAKLCSNGRDFYGFMACLEQHRQQLSPTCASTAFGGSASSANEAIAKRAVSVYDGYYTQIFVELNTPLFYSTPEKTPVADTVWFAVTLCRTQPAPKGLMFYHSGGPLPSIEPLSIYIFPDDFLEEYDIVSVDQRGMGLSAIATVYGIDPSSLSDGQIYDFLNDTVSRGLKGNLAQRVEVQGVGKLAPRCADLAESMPFSVPGDWGNVELLYKYLDDKMKMTTSCMDRYRRDAGDGSSYQPLQYVGTGALVYDIEWMRWAFGAPSITVVGASYGTRVAAAYSSAFPNSLKRVAVTGVMAPQPDLLKYAEEAARNVAQVLGFIQSECAAMGPACTTNPFSEEDAEKPEYVFTGGINEAIDELFARSSSGGSWYLEKCGKPLPMQLMTNLFTQDLTGMEDIPLFKEIYGEQGAVQDLTWPTFFSILPSMVFLFLQNPCAAVSFFGREGSGWKDVSVYGLIPALDMTGRWSRAQTAQTMTVTGSDPTFGPGLNMFILYSKAMYGWPTLPMPIGFANKDVPTIIAQTLYDDRTGMNMAQEYKRNFGDSVMVTAVGGGHCVWETYHPEAWDMLLGFLRDGTRPHDGTITGASPVVRINFEFGALRVKQVLGSGRLQKLALSL